jgi:hypothetical protein
MADEPTMTPDELLVEIIAAVAGNVAEAFEREARREIDATINRKQEKDLALFAVHRAAQMAVVYYQRPLIEGLVYETPEKGEKNAVKRAALCQEIIDRYTRTAHRRFVDRQTVFKDGKRLIG